MKRNADKYTNVDTLPDNAVTVKQYADSLNISTAYIYKLIKLGKHVGRFDIVTFQTINFIIPA
jgi:hypothetical protein